MDHDNVNSEWGWPAKLKDRFPHQAVLKSYKNREEATNWSKIQTGTAVTIDCDIYCFADEETALLFALRFS